MLNAEKIFSLVYKSVNMTDLLWCLGTVEQNRLIIGKHIMWLVVARTGHKNHFVGTERRISSKTGGRD